MSDIACGQWINENDARPNVGEWVLHVYNEGMLPRYGYFDGSLYVDKYGVGHRATHWLRIPELKINDNHNE